MGPLARPNYERIWNEVRLIDRVPAGSSHNLGSERVDCPLAPLVLAVPSLVLLFGLETALGA